MSRIIKDYISDFAKRVVNNVPPVLKNEMLISPRFSFLTAGKREIHSFKSTYGTVDIMLLPTSKIPGALPKLHHTLRILLDEYDLGRKEYLIEEVLDRLYRAVVDTLDPDLPNVYALKKWSQIGNRQEIMFWVPIHFLDLSYSQIAVACNREVYPINGEWPIRIKAFKLCK